MQEFQKVQLQFADHIRDPIGNAPVSGLEERRLQIYRDLFFNNVKGFLDSSFPVLKTLYDCCQWQALAREFFITHQCSSPYFIDISKEFVEFLSNEYQRQATDPVFLEELAHYEWIELALSTRIQKHDFSVWDGETPVSKVVFSPLAELLSYQFPVHHISTDFQPLSSEGITYLVVNRQQTDEVKFTEINALSAHLLSVVEQQELEVAELIQQMQRDLPQFPEEQIAQGTQQIVQQMLSAEILLPC